MGLIEPLPFVKPVRIQTLQMGSDFKLNHIHCAGGCLYVFYQQPANTFAAHVCANKQFLYLAYQSGMMQQVLTMTADVPYHITGTFCHPIDGMLVGDIPLEQCIQYIAWKHRVFKRIQKTIDSVEVGKRCRPYGVRCYGRHTLLDLKYDLAELFAILHTLHGLVDLFEFVYFVDHGFELAALDKVEH